MTRPELSPEQAQKLKDLHGSDLVLVAARMCDLVFRKPTRHEYDRWFDKMQGDKSQASSHARELATATIVYPDQDTLRSVLDDTPGILTTTLVDAITDLAGLGGKAAVKKL
jgi:hypothetical protein